MRNIIKKTEPRSLTQHRAATPADYDGYKDKELLRDSLVTEQRGICCYCMGRIRAKIGSTKIEHWQSQSKNPLQSLVYSNLLGACMGNEGQRHSDQHCDSFKGDEFLSRNPANPSDNVEAIIRYLSDGRISSSIPVFDDDLNRVLNLNVHVLVNHRKEVLRAFQRTLDKRGTMSRQQWQQLLLVWNGEAFKSDLEPFCQVIVYWITKKIDRLAD